MAVAHLAGKAKVTAFPSAPLCGGANSVPTRHGEQVPPARRYQPWPELFLQLPRSTIPPATTDTNSSRKMMKKPQHRHVLHRCSCSHSTFKGVTTLA